MPNLIIDTLTLKYGYVIASDLAHDDERCSQSRWWWDEIGSLSHEQVRSYAVKKLKEWILKGEFIEQVTSEITEFEEARNNAQVFAEWEKHTLPWVTEKEIEYDFLHNGEKDSTTDESTFSPRIF